MNPASDLVNKLWRLCAVLRKDGITYQQYVTELTYLLFLKMMAEQKREEGRIPDGMRWRDLAAAEGIRQLSLYRTMLTRLKEDYDYLVIDSHAVLATLDTPLLAQHTDAVLFAVQKHGSRLAHCSRSYVVKAK